MPVLFALIAVVLFLAYRKTRATDTTAVPGDAISPVQFFQSKWQDNLDNVSQAIFQFEGGHQGDLNVRNNNPGNLRSGPNMAGTSGGYATFSDIGDGWDALNGYILSKSQSHPTWDLYDFFNYYLRGSTTAPSVDAQGNSDSYAEYVANFLGVSPTTQLGDLFSNQ